MNKRTIALSLASVAVATLVAVPSFAQGLGFGWGNGGVPPSSEKGAVPPKFEDSTDADGRRGLRPEPTAEMTAQRDAIEAAIAAGNYTAWVAAVNNEKLTEQVTAEEFSRYVQMQALMEQAQNLMEQAQTIGEEIGLDYPQPGFGFMGQGRGRGLGPDHGMPTDESTETDD